MEIVKKQMAYNYSVRNTAIKYIVVHDTGNRSEGADARAHFNYFNTGNRGSSADIFVDDRSCWVVNDYIKYYSWHCGDGKGKYGITNANSIGVEMCVNSDGDYAAAVGNTVEVVRDLINELNIPPDRVVRHYDASRKNCPASMSENNWAMWNEFKNMLKEADAMTSEERVKFNALVEAVAKLTYRLDAIENKMIYNYIDDNMPKWARPTIQKLVSKGVLKGDENGLNLTDDLLRLLVINDRAGIYD